MSSVDNFQHHWFMVGKASALEDLATMLRKRSGEFFSVGRDKDAGILRDLAAEVEDKGAVARTEANSTRDVVYPGIRAIDLLARLWMTGGVDKDKNPKLYEEIEKFITKDRV